MSSRAKQRADRIRSEVPIIRVLADYGYHVNPDGEDREQQFSCDLHGSGQDRKPSARVYPSTNSWYCVSQADRVLTPVGWVPLGATQHTPPTLDGDGDFRNPLAYMDQGHRECVTVRSKSGYQVTLTHDHEVAVGDSREWVKAADLTPGDELVIPLPKEPLFNSDLTLPVNAASFNTRTYKGQPPLNVPCHWSLPLGEALGYIFGDGWVTPRPQGCSGLVGLTSSAEDAEDARQVFQHLQFWAGGRGSEVHRNGTLVKTPNGNVYAENQYVFTVGNDGFCEWIQQMGLTKEGPPQMRRLPPTIWNAPREGVVGFLRGVYATDGSVFHPKDRKGIRVNLYSVSEGFLQDIQLLLLQCGVLSRLHRPATTRPGGVWYLQIATGKDVEVFRQRIGIANRRKQALLDSFRWNPRGSRPARVFVHSVTPVGVLPVADLTMPGTPSFVAGGIKVHNCFGCGQTRDAIQTCRAKEGKDFWAAIQALETRYRLPPLPWEEDIAPASVSDIVREHLNADFSFEEQKNRLLRFLQNATDERETPLSQLLTWWETFDQIVYEVESMACTEQQGSARCEHLLGHCLSQMTKQGHP